MKQCAGSFLTALLLAAFGVAGPRTAFAQTSSAASAPQAAPAPSAETLAVVADAVAKATAGQFAEAVAALTTAPASPLSPDDKQTLDFALADMQETWGRSLILTSQYDEARAQLNAALAIDQLYPQRQDQMGTDLLGIGITYADLSQYERAIGYYAQVLPIYQKVKDQNGEASTLGNLGNAYRNLSQYEKAIEFYQQVLPIYQEEKDRDDEANVFNSLGIAYGYLSQNEKAIGFSQQALPIFREVKNQNGEASALNNLGNTYLSLSQRQKAIEFYQQALPIYQKIKDRNGLANVLNNLGTAYGQSNQYEKAIGYYVQALPIYQQVRDRNGEAKTLDNLSLVWSLSDNSQRLPVVAIFFGKQEVNLYQTIRDDIKGLGKSTRKVYADSLSDRYQRLAALLTAQGREPEAQQALNLLKEPESFDAANRDATAPSGFGKVGLTPQEQVCADRYQQLADNLAALETRRQTLAATQPRDAAQDAEYAQVQTDLEAATHAFQAFLTDLPHNLAPSATPPQPH